MKLCKMKKEIYPEKSIQKDNNHDMCCKRIANLAPAGVCESDITASKLAVIDETVFADN